MKADASPSPDGWNCPSQIACYKIILQMENRRKISDNTPLYVKLHCNLENDSCCICLTNRQIITKNTVKLLSRRTLQAELMQKSQEPETKYLKLGSFSTSGGFVYFY